MPTGARERKAREQEVEQEVTARLQEDQPGMGESTVAFTLCASCTSCCSWRGCGAWEAGLSSSPPSILRAVTRPLL